MLRQHFFAQLGLALDFSHPTYESAHELDQDCAALFHRATPDRLHIADDGKIERFQIDDCLESGLLQDQSVSGIENRRRHAAALQCQNAVVLTEIGKHTSELQSRENLVCRLLLEKK